jgi:hypothetical protein
LFDRQKPFVIPQGADFRIIGRYLAQIQKRAAQKGRRSHIGADDPAFPINEDDALIQGVI